MVVIPQDSALLNPLTSLSSLNISVADVNDQDPIFEQHHYHVQLYENSTAVYIARYVHPVLN